jgi:2-polyprenyl-6-methoxyphenol hydroxylase-like FAD-dependent oxidoreductase
MPDVIIVGARCAGAPTAMLLARLGHRVLLVDRATFPSDTISTHVVHPPAVAALARWGLLERLVATGCPLLEAYSFDFGPVEVAGVPRAAAGLSAAYCPRRTILDALLVDAATEAGAEVRQGFAVEEILFADGVVAGVRGRSRGGETVERARLVIGADGRHSVVAAAVRAPLYDERPSRTAMYYAYWSGLDVDGFATTVRGEQRRGWAAAPTHDGLTVVGVGWPAEEFRRNRGDIAGSVRAALALDAPFAERVDAATRESRFAGSAELGGWFRRPFGPGWALVGDAGYHKNPITAMGITDAFRDAELLATAIDDVLTGRRAYDDALGEYQRTRDQLVRPMYELTDDFARLAPPPPELQRLLGAIEGDREAMDDFVSVQAGTLPPSQFFARANVARLLGEDRTVASSP